MRYPHTLTGFAWRLAARIIPMPPDEVSMVDEFASAAFGGSPLEIAYQRVACWIGFVFWALIAVVVMFSLVLIGWLSDSSALVVAIHAVLLGAAVGEVAIWGGRWSRAFSIERRWGEEHVVVLRRSSVAEWSGVAIGLASAAMLLLR